MEKTRKKKLSGQPLEQKSKRRNVMPVHRKGVQSHILSPLKTVVMLDLRLKRNLEFSPAKSRMTQKSKTSKMIRVYLL